MLNKTVVQGRLVADPELRTTQGGTMVCSFRIASSEAHKEKERKLFLNCTAWRGLAEMVAKYFTKGREIIVEGALETKEYQTKAGEKRTAIELNAYNVHFVGTKGNDTAPAQNAAQGFTEVAENDGDLPF